MGKVKRCKMCKLIKSMNYFYKNKAAKDGFQSYCKMCTKANTAKWIRGNWKRNMERRKVRYDKIKNTDEYKKRNSQHKKKHNRNNKLKYIARNVVTNHLTNGRLQRGVCEICGDIKSEAHHEDYNYPLKIKWLCKKHHRKVHLAEGFK